MKVSINWLKKYCEDIDTIKDLSDFISLRAFEVESVEEINGDKVIDLDVLPNRAHDCLCHRGVAKEISLITGLNFKDDNLPYSGSDINPQTKVEVQDPNCKIYNFVEIKNISNDDSPEWLKKSLESIGQRSINKVVDILNYVMFDIGGPLHAFDLDKIEGDIIVRNSKPGEKITLLDDSEIELKEGTLLIADNAGPLAIAGLKGGKRAEVTKETKNILIESANFNGVYISKISRAYNINSESSKRYEKEITSYFAEEALIRSLVLINKECGGENSKIIKVIDRLPNHYIVGLDIKKLNSLLGSDYSEKEVIGILEKIECNVIKLVPRDKILEDKESLLGKPYKYGASVLLDSPNQFDCSSLTAYLYSKVGLAIPRVSGDQYYFSKRITKDELKPGDLIFANSEDGDKTNTETIDYMKGSKLDVNVDHVGIYVGDGKVMHSSRYLDNGLEIEDIQQSKSFGEKIVGYGMIPEIDKERLVVAIPHSRLDLRIPEDLIEEIGRMLGYENIQSKPLSDFDYQNEINKEFYLSQKIRKILIQNGFSEILTSSFRKKGVIETAKPFAKDKSFLRTTLIDSIKDSLEINRLNLPILGLDNIKIFEIGKVFPSKDREVLSLAVGTTNKKENLEEIVGLLERELNLKLDFEKSDNIILINLSEIIDQIEVDNDFVLDLESKEIKYTPYSVYPFIARDIAVWVPGDLSKDYVEKVILENTNTDLMKSIKLFDVYKKDNQTSYAFRLVFQSDERTLEDSEINVVMENIEKAFNSNNWTVR